MNLKLILCALGRHRWVIVGLDYAKRHGQNDTLRAMRDRAHGYEFCSRCRIKRRVSVTGGSFEPERDEV